MESYPTTRDVVARYRLSEVVYGVVYLYTQYRLPQHSGERGYLSILNQATRTPRKVKIRKKQEQPEKFY